MKTQDELNFPLVYNRLKNILEKYAIRGLQMRTAKSDQVELVGPPTPASLGKEVWFGAVRIGKRYVSYHLMPIYACPDLLDGLSIDLKKRMQGKSCFNFTQVNEPLFQELDELTEKGYRRFKKEGLIL